MPPLVLLFISYVAAASGQVCGKGDDTCGDMPQGDAMLQSLQTPVPGPESSRPERRGGRGGSLLLAGLLQEQLQQAHYYIGQTLMALDTDNEGTPDGRPQFVVKEFMLHFSRLKVDVQEKFDNSAGKCDFDWGQYNDESLFTAGFLISHVMCCIMQNVTGDVSTGEVALLTEAELKMWEMLADNNTQSFLRGQGFHIFADQVAVVGEIPPCNPDAAAGEMKSAARSLEAVRGQALLQEQVSTRTSLHSQAMAFKQASKSLTQLVRSKGGAVSHAEFSDAFYEPCQAMRCRSAASAWHIMAAARRHVLELERQGAWAATVRQHLVANHLMEQLLPHIAAAVGPSFLQFQMGNDSHLMLLGSAAQAAADALVQTDERLQVGDYVKRMETSAARMNEVKGSPSKEATCSAGSGWCFSFSWSLSYGCGAFFPVFQGPGWQMGISTSISAQTGPNKVSLFPFSTEVQGLSISISVSFPVVQPAIPGMTGMLGGITLGAVSGLSAAASISPASCAEGIATSGNGCKVSLDVGMGVSLIAPALSNPLSVTCPSLGFFRFQAASQSSFGFKMLCSQLHIGGKPQLGASTKTEWKGFQNYAWTLRNDPHGGAPMLSGCRLPCHRNDDDNYNNFVKFGKLPKYEDGSTTSIVQMDVGGEELWGIDEKRHVWRFSSCSQEWERQDGVPNRAQSITAADWYVFVGLNDGKTMICNRNCRGSGCSHPCRDRWHITALNGYSISTQYYELFAISSPTKGVLSELDYDAADGSGTVVETGGYCYNCDHRRRRCWAKPSDNAAFVSAGHSYTWMIAADTDSTDDQSMAVYYQAARRRSPSDYWSPSSNDWYRAGPAKTETGANIIQLEANSDQVYAVTDGHDLLYRNSQGNDNWKTRTGSFHEVQEGVYEEKDDYKGTFRKVALDYYATG